MLGGSVVSLLIFTSAKLLVFHRGPNLACAISVGALSIGCLRF